MTQEYNDFVGYQNPDSAEHSAPAKAKKVITGPMIVPAGLTPNDDRTIDPIQAATGVELALVRGKAYRLIASVAIYFRQAASTGSVSAAGDIYLPANTPVIISATEFPFVANVAFAAAGIIQAVEVR